MGIGDFFGMIVGFTAGMSVLAFAIAGAKRFASGGARSAARAVRELAEEVDQLRGEIERLRGDVEQARRPPELEEIQNRLDFAERMLGQMKARDALPGPR